MSRLAAVAAVAVLIAATPALAQEELAAQSAPTQQCTGDPALSNAAAAYLDPHDFDGIQTGSIAPPAPPARPHGH